MAHMRHVPTILDVIMPRNEVQQPAPQIQLHCRLIEGVGLRVSFSKSQVISYPAHLGRVPRD